MCKVSWKKSITKTKRKAMKNSKKVKPVLFRQLFFGLAIAAYMSCSLQGDSSSDPPSVFPIVPLAQHMLGATELTSILPTHSRDAMVEDIKTELVEDSSSDGTDASLSEPFIALSGILSKWSYKGVWILSCLGRQQVCREESYWLKD